MSVIRADVQSSTWNALEILLKEVVEKRATDNHRRSMAGLKNSLNQEPQGDVHILLTFPLGHCV